MIQLQGETVVRDFLTQKIDEAEKELVSDVQGIEREFFTLVLGLIEGAIPLADYPQNIQNYLLSIKHDLVQVLDSLLKRDVLDTIPLTHPTHIPGVIGAVSIGTIHPDNIRRAFDVLIKQFELLSAPKTLLLQCEMSNRYSIEIDDNSNVLFDTVSFRRARSAWINNSTANANWESYFFNNPTNNLSNFRNEISSSLEKLHGFRLSHLNYIGTLLDMMYQDGNPIGAHVTSPVQFDYFGRFVTIPSEAIREGFHNQFPDLSASDVDNFLDSLVYRGGDIPTRTPFFRIGTRSPPTYFVWTSVPVFRASWISEVTSGGTLGTRYGNAFEEYVRKRIHDNTRLSIYPTGLTILRTTYSDMTSSFDSHNREKIQIDAFACDDTRSYIISCKAHDLLSDQENRSRLLVSPYSDFYSRSMRNYDEVMEVCQWVDILQSSQEFYDKYNLGQRELVPVLITPRPDPLQYEQVRSWFAGVNPSRNIPYCEVLSIADFETKFAVS